MAPLLPLATALASVERRAGAAQTLARALGGEVLLAFVLDRAVDALVPALGFPQTTTGGPDWDAAFAAWRSPGLHGVKGLAYPTRGELRDGAAWVADDGTVLLLLGGQPSFERVDELAIPLLAALFSTEQREAAARGEAIAAREAVRRAELVASVAGGRGKT